MLHHFDFEQMYALITAHINKRTYISCEPSLGYHDNIKLND